MFGQSRTFIFPLRGRTRASDMPPDGATMPPESRNTARASVRLGDLVLVPGDVSMARNHRDVQADLAWLDRLPGTKVLAPGNHDQWWNGIEKIRPMLRGLDRGRGRGCGHASRRRRVRDGRRARDAGPKIGRRVTSAIRGALRCSGRALEDAGATACRT